MEVLGLLMMGLVVLCQIKGSVGLRFVIDREECFSHDAKYDGDTVHVSFVVIKIESTWHYNQDGVNLVVKGPNGEQLLDIREKTSEKFEFVVQKAGVHHFCFINKSPYHETIILMYILRTLHTLTSMLKMSISNPCSSRFRSWRKPFSTSNLNSTG